MLGAKQNCAQTPSHTQHTKKSWYISGFFLLFDVTGCCHNQGAQKVCCGALLSSPVHHHTQTCKQTLNFSMSLNTQQLNISSTCPKPPQQTPCGVLPLHPRHSLSIFLLIRATRSLWGKRSLPTRCTLDPVLGVVVTTECLVFPLQATKFHVDVSRI